MSARVIAVTGGKGGVGKSATSVNLGVSLRMDGYDVAIVDTDIEMPNLVEMFGLDPTTTVHDVLSGQAEPEEALIELGDGFAIMPGDPELSSFAAVDPTRLQRVVSDLRELKDFVILDTGAGLSYDDVLPLSLADEVLLVSSPDPPAVQNAVRTEGFVARLNQKISGVVITRATEPPDDAVSDRFDTQILGVIPEDDAVRESTAAGQPLEVYDPDSRAAKAYRQLEAVLTDGDLPPSNARKRNESTASADAQPEQSGSTSPTQLEGDDGRHDDDEAEGGTGPAQTVTTAQSATTDTEQTPRSSEAGEAASSDGSPEDTQSDAESQAGDETLDEADNSGLFSRLVRRLGA